MLWLSAHGRDHGALDIAERDLAHGESYKEWCHLLSLIGHSSRRPHIALFLMSERLIDTSRDPEHRGQERSSPCHDTSVGRQELLSRHRG
jgi:hypothetical protein